MNETKITNLLLITALVASSIWRLSETSSSIYWLPNISYQDFKINTITSAKQSVERGQTSISSPSPPQRYASTENASTSVGNNQNVQGIDELRNQFWEMIRDGVRTKQRFDEWYSDYVGVQKTTIDEYRVFYNKYLSNSDQFRRYYNVPTICLQKSGRDLKKLENAIIYPYNYC